MNPIFMKTAYMFVAACTAILIMSVVINFISQNKDKSKEKKSRVATLQMVAFMVAIYLLVIWRKCILKFPDDVSLAFMITGMALVLAGTAVNILGRINLGKYWANQIKIYRSHKLIRNGAFNLVRHPLYASLIWLLIGVSFIYMSYIVLLATILIFIPMMYYRARQEEKILGRRFREYSRYKSEVGMFFPRIIRFFRRNAVLPGVKLSAAAILLAAYLLKNNWLVLLAFAFSIVPFFLTFGKFVVIKQCHNPLTKYVRKRMVGALLKIDINELRFTLLFGASTIIAAFILIHFGNLHLGYLLVLIMFFFKLLSGFGICGGSYLYYSIFRFCPVCRIGHYIGEKSKENKHKKK